MVTTPLVRDDPWVGLFSVTDTADDLDVPGMPGPGLLVDVDLLLALEPTEPIDVTVPDPGVEVLIGRTVVEVLIGHSLTSGAQLVMLITSVVYTIPPVTPVGIGMEIEVLLTGYGALDVGPKLRVGLPEAPVRETEIGTEAPVPIVLVREVVLFVGLLLDCVVGAEPVGASGAVGPAFVVELVLPVEDKAVDVDVLDVVDVKESTGFPVEDESVEAEVLDWLEELGAEGVVKLLVDDEVVETDVLDSTEVVETEEVDIEAEDVGFGKVDVIDVCLAQFDCSNSLLSLSV